MMNTLASIAMILFAPSESISSMECELSSYYENDWDRDMDNTQSGRFLNGVFSSHNDYYEDRRFQWRYCKPESMSDFPSGDTTSLTTTAYDEEWVRTCSGYNGGQSAINGIVSHHDDGHEDRTFKIKCAKLDETRYRMTGCSWTGWLNSYDGQLRYYCSSGVNDGTANGVIRGIQSRHDNDKEDRQFKFECCDIEDISYSFEGLEGHWDLLDNCGGCSEHSYTVSDGISRSESSSFSTTDSWSMALGMEISAGFEFLFGPSLSSTFSMSAEMSQSVSRSMQTSLTRSHTESVTRKCEKDNLYQWVITGTEKDSKGADGQFSAWSNFFLCTDNYEPQCPPGYCLPNEDCTHCKAPFCGNMDSGCSSEIDWAVQEGKWGHPEYYDSFKQVTGVELYQANEEDMALYFYCTNTKPNGHCDELTMPCTDRVCGEFEACGFIPDSCQSELDWAVTDGKWNHPEFYPHFEENTGIQLRDATKEDISLYWHCASINPNGNCPELEIPCNRQCAN